MQPLHELSADEYACLDIAAVNLACAEGLVGSEQIDLERYLATIDHWAELVADKTKRFWPQFVEDPASYENSEAYFCMLVLVTVLQRDLGVQYATDTLQDNYDATDSRLHFLHGILEGRGGTCATMPVLYAAIGRRLGYPLRLVQGIEHIFVRWDDPQTGERFNIESTSSGLNVRPDEYYKSWPVPALPEHLEKGWLLRSFEPIEELALFYEIRGRCCLDWIDIRQAFELASHATRLGGGKVKSCRSMFLEVMEILYRSASGQAQYSLRNSGGWGVIREEIEGNRRERPMTPQERSATFRAEKELQRIHELHEARRLAGQSYVEIPAILQFTHEFA